MAVCLNVPIHYIVKIKFTTITERGYLVQWWRAGFRVKGRAIDSALGHVSLKKLPH